MSLPVTDAAPPASEEPAARGTAGKAAFYVGSAGLLLATAADSIAVLGRHTGFALLGSIEIVQVAIVFIAAASLVTVTLNHGHAAVHIVTDRLAPGRRALLARVAALLGAAAVGLLLIGSVILLGDVWNGHERSELLHIPLRWLRLLMIVALGFVALLFLKAAVARRPATEAGHDA
ncbi:TRAP transporter small permease subunit [Sphingomonas sp. IC-56]|uniref:TRAP transporter small permease subunit n=1 Tax=Sphingomonas sp. IC-56 TaxID=2898529 RepID=UPI001E48F9E1|nr:TRAP transporter small permease subunit [Sphingomonas sp. IC-56]